jgi:L-ribulose-5-phosphate 3-epimerase
VNDINYKFLLVQGRAIPQTENYMQYFPSNWREEFLLINKLGFSGIEWIYDKNSELSNPILTKTGRTEMLYISKKNNVNLENIVFDWFLSYSFLQKNNLLQEKNIEKFLSLMQNCSDVGFKRIIFPLLDKNKINSDKEIVNLIKIFDKKIIDPLNSLDIEIHFETSLSPEKEKQIMESLNHEKLKICFDMGNSASEGFDPVKVITILDKNLGSVHIKDRTYGGSSTPLGQGDVNFFKVFESLKQIDFNGPISFQIYRNKDSDNISILKGSLTFINEIISKIVNDSK